MGNYDNNKEQDFWIRIWLAIVILLLIGTFLFFVLYESHQNNGSVLHLFSKVEQLPEHPVVPDYSEFKTFDPIGIYTMLGAIGAAIAPVGVYAFKTMHKNKTSVAVIKNDIKYIRESIERMQKDDN